jgi:hypothetical protein
MAINIQKLINALEAKINAASPTLPAVELGRLTRANRVLNEVNSIIDYETTDQLPEATQYNQGRILWNAETQNYVVNSLGTWKNITLVPDILKVPYVGYDNAFHVGGSAEAAGNNDTVDKFAYASDVITQSFTTIPSGTYYSQSAGGGLSSETEGYAVGGSKFSLGTPGNFGFQRLSKFNFSSGAATGFPTTHNPPGVEGGPTASSKIDGYGFIGAASISPSSSPQTKQKLAFASDAFSVSGTATPIKIETGSGCQSSTFGYEVGGRYNSVPNTTPYSQAIRKYPFANDGNPVQITTSLSIYTNGLAAAAGTQGPDGAGYLLGGDTTQPGPAPPTSPTGITTVSRFPFASDAETVASVGSIAPVAAQAIYWKGRTAWPGITHGYSNGGYYPNPIGSQSALIKFAWGSSVTFSELGQFTLLASSGAASGIQI